MMSTSECIEPSDFYIIIIFMIDTYSTTVTATTFIISALSWVHPIGSVELILIARTDCLCLHDLSLSLCSKAQHYHKTAPPFAITRIL